MLLGFVDDSLEKGGCILGVDGGGGGVGRGGGGNGDDGAGEFDCESTKPNLTLSFAKFIRSRTLSRLALTSEEKRIYIYIQQKKSIQI